MNLLVMAGTKDAIKIIEMLSKNNESSFKGNSNKETHFNILSTTTTRYGAILAKKAGAYDAISRPLDKDELVNLIQKKDVKILIDATHPFATQASTNAINASKKASIKYIRFERPSINYSNVEGIHIVNSYDEAGQFAKNIIKNNEKKVLHLAGVSTIKSILKSVPLNQLIVRVLPNTTSVGICEEIGISGKNIVAMQGTFSKEFNQALMREYDVGVVITKESGETGGVPSKIDAALEIGLELILINRPEIKELNENSVVNTIEELQKKLEEIIK
ncbi:MAG: precorrin-6A reductase [Methanobacteriaceae archaeon]|nr:precorrin-6A reductase [Methanobacteriaceae archaeon]MDP2837092.1 precorrin-6A reductase [Methanobacteriaceae archaeon]MDP3034064.1 precorrin-6A reductase [Methanobacteriaceae archaeon]MDP3485631.1 precorrin-6A reductase [Methanobacteriaceae archaeon]MDP3623311.1 precorrin-6A reductase [Methanobacteriaceae archaeon]